MSGAPFHRSASWAPTVAMSWFWGLGFCFSMHVVLTYGWGAFAAFAATNATGLFLFGALCGRAGTDPAKLFRIAQDRAGVALVAYQIVAVAITGIAGPGGGSAEKPVGLVHFGLAQREGGIRLLERRYGDLGRAGIRCAAVADALGLLEEAIRG